MNKNNFDSVNEVTNLGVTFSNNWKFSQQIAKKINKANSMVALIKGTFKYLDKHSFLRLYTAAVRSRLEFVMLFGVRVSENRKEGNYHESIIYPTSSVKTPK